MSILNEKIFQKLRYLSGLPEADSSFLSLYLHINAHNFLEQAEKNRIFLKNHLSKSNSREITDFIENRVDTKTHGLAIFTCDELGVFETFQSIMPFENSFALNSIPHLKQLAHHADTCENALLIMTDKRCSRIFNVEIGGFILDEMSMENEIHRFHKQGGWAQMRYQRHIENQALHHYRETARVAASFLDNNPYDNLILIGQHHEIKHLQEYLPKRTNAKVIDINTFGSAGMRENTGHILETVVSSLHANKTRKELENVENVIHSSPQVVAGGWQDTIQLIEEGRADTVIIPGYKTYVGWKCDGCLYIAKEQHQAGCPVCRNSFRRTDLTEEAVRLIFRNSGKLELVDNEAAEKLEPLEGIAALLRY